MADLEDERLDDDVSDVLQNSRRLQILQYLLAQDGTVRVSDLAEHIAAQENNVEITDITYKERKRSFTSLHQTHLPKLASKNLIDFDSEKGTVKMNETGLTNFRDRYDISLNEYLRANDIETTEAPKASSTHTITLGILAIVVTSSTIIFSRGWYQSVAVYLLPVLVAALFILFIRNRPQQI